MRVEINPGHEEIIGPGDLVATDVSENPDVSHLITGRVETVDKDGRVTINISPETSFVTFIENVQWLMRATQQLWRGTGRNKHRRR